MFGHVSDDETEGEGGGEGGGKEGGKEEGEGEVKQNPIDHRGWFVDDRGPYDLPLNRTKWKAGKLGKRLKL
jgi:hypothetical protein